MPETAQKKNKHQVEIGPGRALSVSAQRDIEIISKPGGE